ncbi:hypothetical protein [Eubacterium aggregans]
MISEQELRKIVKDVIAGMDISGTTQEITAPPLIEVQGEGGDLE